MSSPNRPRKKQRAYKLTAEQVAEPMRLLDELTDAQISSCLEICKRFAPKTLQSRYLRAIYATLSFQADWQANGLLHMAATGMMPWENEKVLADALEKTRRGLHKAKAKYLLSLQKYRLNPEKVTPNGKIPVILASPEQAGWGYNWVAYRDHMVKNVKPYLGCGPKVLSFYWEMCYPGEAGVIAVDSHMFDLYKVPKGPRSSLHAYKAVEAHWINACRERDWPPDIARHCIYDKFQDYKHPVWWMYVFPEAVELRKLKV